MLSNKNIINIYTNLYKFITFLYNFFFKIKLIFSPKKFFFKSFYFFFLKSFFKNSLLRLSITFIIGFLVSLLSLKTITFKKMSNIDNKKIMKRYKEKRAIVFIFDEYGHDHTFDKDGFDKDGFDKDGFDKDGFDKDGFDENSLDKLNLSKDIWKKDRNTNDLHSYQSWTTKYSRLIFFKKISNIYWLKWYFRFSWFFKHDFFVSSVIYIYLYFLSNFFKKKYNYNKNNFNYKTFNVNNNYLKKSKKNLFFNSKLLLYGIYSIWMHIRLWILPVTIVCLFFYYSFFLKSLPFIKVIFGYFLIFNMFYLLLSGFVFFFKKYQYRLYTTAIQRFWRRSLIIFWLIEISLFVVFIYLTLNASQEPIHMYDTLQIHKTHFYSWRYFLLKIVTSSLLLVFVYLLLLFNKWNTFSKVNNIVFIITILLFYIFWLEFYQFFYILTSYGKTNWHYKLEEHIWNLEVDFKRTRIVNHYVTICLIAKFWHILFTVIFWVFFVLRGIESSRFRYPLLVSNLQNFFIIYFMSWVYMYPWFKFFFRKILDWQYYWFFLNNRRLGFFLFCNDIKLFYWGILDFFNVFLKDYYCFFKKNAFFYWFESSYMSSNIGNTQFRKHTLRDFFIRSFELM